MLARLYLLVAVSLASLLGACNPLQERALFGEKGPDTPPAQSPPDAGQAPDAGAQTPDAGAQTPDAASIPCWQKRQLATNAENMVFTFDAQGVGHFAFNRGSKVYLGSTRPGDIPTPIDALVGSVRGIAVDSQGQRHLVLAYSYMSAYAREQQGSWQHIELIPGGLVRLSLDASGFAHMLLGVRESYDSPGTYVYVTNRSGSWEVTKLDSLSSAVTLADVEFDAHGHVHIAYIDYGMNKGSYYATNASGVWASELVTKVAGYDIALALDSEGRPHLLYTSGSQSYYVTKREGTWEFSLGGTAAGSTVYLKVDAAGNLHSLLDWMNKGEIGYAFLPASGKQWSFAPPLSLEWEGQQTFLWNMVLGLNAAGEVRIGYWGSVPDSGGNTNHMYAEQCPRAEPTPRP